MHDFHVQSFSFLGRLESVIHLTDELITKQCPACLVIDGLILALHIAHVSEHFLLFRTECPHHRLLSQIVSNVGWYSYVSGCE